MTDQQWKQLLALLVRYGETELDQHAHFSVPIFTGNRLYVRFTLTPIHAHGERDEHYPLVDPTTGYAEEPR